MNNTRACLFRCLLFALAFSAAVSTGCNGARTPQTGRGAEKKPGPASTTMQGVLHETDFKNFSYKTDEQEITLKNGLWRSPEIIEGTDKPEMTYEFESVHFGDFLGNGGEQAAVTLFGHTPGASCCEWRDVFLFEARHGKPVQIGAVSGEMTAVIPDKGVVAVRTGLFTEEDARCCPSNVMVTQYRFGANGFEKSRVQVFPAENVPDEITAMKLDYTPAVLPKIYKDDLACPFECCAFARWTAQEPFTVREKPDDKARIVGNIKTGERFEAVTGIAFVKPGRFNVVKPFSDPWTGTQADPGDQIYELTYLGEGWSKYWYYGHIGDQSFLDVCGDEYASEACWLERVSEPEAAWWVKVKLSNGTVGWIKDPYNVDGAYGC
jgi:hypothetical protein